MRMTLTKKTEVHATHYNGFVIERLTSPNGRPLKTKGGNQPPMDGETKGYVTKIQLADLNTTWLYAAKYADLKAKLVEAIQHGAVPAPPVQ